MAQPIASKLTQKRMALGQLGHPKVEQAIHPIKVRRLGNLDIRSAGQPRLAPAHPMSVSNRCQRLDTNTRRQGRGCSDGKVDAKKTLRIEIDEWHNFWNL
jgi:hypothetical protein